MGPKRGNASDGKDGTPVIRPSSSEQELADVTSLPSSSSTGQNIPLPASLPSVIPETPSDPTGPNTFTPPNSALPTEQTSGRVSSLRGSTTILEDAFEPFKDMEKHFEGFPRAEGSINSADDVLDTLAKPDPLSFRKQSGAEDRVGDQELLSKAPLTHDFASSIYLRGGSGNASDDDYEKITPDPSSRASASAIRFPKQPLTVGVDAPPTSFDPFGVEESGKGYKEGSLPLPKEIIDFRDWIIQNPNNKCAKRASGPVTAFIALLEAQMTENLDLQRARYNQKLALNNFNTTIHTKDSENAVLTTLIVELKKEKEMAKSNDKELLDMISQLQASTHEITKLKQKNQDDRIDLQKELEVHSNEIRRLKAQLEGTITKDECRDQIKRETDKLNNDHGKETGKLKDELNTLNSQLRSKISRDEGKAQNQKEIDSLNGEHQKETRKLNEEINDLRKVLAEKDEKIAVTMKVTADMEQKFGHEDSQFAHRLSNAQFQAQITDLKKLHQDSDEVTKLRAETKTPDQESDEMERLKTENETLKKSLEESFYAFKTLEDEAMKKAGLERRKYRQDLAIQKIKLEHEKDDLKRHYQVIFPEPKPPGYDPLKDPTSIEAIMKQLEEEEPLDDDELFQKRLEDDMKRAQARKETHAQARAALAKVDWDEDKIDEELRTVEKMATLIEKRNATEQTITADEGMAKNETSNKTLVDQIGKLEKELEDGKTELKILRQLDPDHAEPDPYQGRTIREQIANMSQRIRAHEERIDELQQQLGGASILANQSAATISETAGVQFDQMQEVTSLKQANTRLQQQLANATNRVHEATGYASNYARAQIDKDAHIRRLEREKREVEQNLARERTAKNLLDNVRRELEKDAQAYIAGGGTDSQIRAALATNDRTIKDLRDERNKLKDKLKGSGEHADVGTIALMNEEVKNFERIIRDRELNIARLEDELRRNQNLNTAIKTTEYSSDPLTQKDRQLQDLQKKLNDRSESHASSSLTDTKALAAQDAVIQKQLEIIADKSKTVASLHQKLANQARNSADSNEAAQPQTNIIAGLQAEVAMLRVSVNEASTNEQVLQNHIFELDEYILMLKDKRIDEKAMVLEREVPNPDAQADSDHIIAKLRAANSKIVTIEKLLNKKERIHLDLVRRLNECENRRKDATSVQSLEQLDLETSSSDVTVDAIIIRTRVALARMVDQRRCVGFKPLDISSSAVYIVRYAVDMAETLQHSRSISRANFWAGIAAYYNDNVEGAYAHFEAAALREEFLDQGERDDLKQWLEDTRDNNTNVDKRMEAYRGHSNGQRGSLASSGSGGNGSGGLQSERLTRKQSKSGGRGVIVK